MPFPGGVACNVVFCLSQGSARGRRFPARHPGSSGPINSETRRPVWTPTRRRVRSRRPNQVEAFGTASSASISSRLRNSMGRRSWRLLGTARIRWQCSACAGSSKATYWKKEWMAPRRAFRVRALFLRTLSRWSRKRPIKGASRSSTRSLEGDFAESFFGKMQKQAEAIAISRDRMRARLPLAEQAIGKEGLKKRGKVGGDHGCTSPAISRSVAS